MLVLGLRTRDGLLRGCSCCSAASLAVFIFVYVVVLHFKMRTVDEDIDQVKIRRFFSIRGWMPLGPDVKLSIGYESMGAPHPWKRGVEDHLISLAGFFWGVDWTLR